MQIRIILLILILAVLKTANAQTPPPPPQTPPPPAINEAALQQQLSILQQQLSDLQKQLSEISQQPNSGDTSSKVIIIDGKNIVISGDDFEKSMRDLTNDSLLLGKGLKIYQNNDSVIVNIGGMKVRVLDQQPDSDAVVIQEEIITELEPEDDDINEDDDGGVIKTQVFSLRMGFNNLMYNRQLNTAPGYNDLELNNAKSLNVGLGIVNMRVNLIKHWLRFNAGLLYDINNYRFTTDASLIPRIDSVAFKPKESTENISKNKLTTTYLMLPVNFTFTSSKESKKAFRMSAGFRVGYRVGAHTKQVVDSKKEKVRDDFNLNPIKYGVTASIGYSWLNLYADYDMTTLFRDNTQPALIPIQVGIVLAGF